MSAGGCNARGVVVGDHEEEGGGGAVKVGGTTVYDL